MRLKFVGSVLMAASLMPAISLAANDKATKTADAKTQAAAQPKADPAAAPADPPAVEEGRLKGRLPSNFGRLGLGDSQRQKIYALQQSYAIKIDDAQAKLKELESKRDADIRAVLTDDQRKQLDTIISASAKARAAKREAKIEPAAAPAPAQANASAKMDPQPAANNNAVAGAKK
jgi:hypothetical protein